MGAFQNELQPLFETECAGSDECRELTKTMAGDHVWLEFVTEALGEQYAVEEDCRLSHLSLFQVIFCTLEHHVGDAEAENFICFLKKFLCFGIVVVEVLAHAYELGTLARKYICFHYLKK